MTLACWQEVLTVEFKVNFLKQEQRIIAIGKVIQSGNTLTVCEGNVYDETGGRLIARMTATIMSIGNN
jgi:acyl-coenzyme A thioesterase PaaI-like protein